MTTLTEWMVLAQSGRDILCADDTGWQTNATCKTEAGRDEAIAAAVEASLPYDVIEISYTFEDSGKRTFHPRRRIGGTAQLFTGKL